MDVLNAELKWIDSRCYRILPRIQNTVQDSINNDEKEELDHSSKFVHEDDEYDPDLLILHKGNSFYIVIHVPVILHRRYIKGYMGRIQKSLEDYGAKVTFPRGETDTGITISGSSKKIVSDTYHRIESMVCSARSKREPTHFISLPVNFQEIKDSFLKFKQEVLEKCKSVRGLDASIFQNPHKLHATITPIVLLDEKDIENAKVILKNCTDNILSTVGKKPFNVHVKGIEYMNDDPEEVDILYAKLKELGDDNRLQIVADSIAQEFVKSTLAMPQYDKVKLHITIMNTLFRQDDKSDRITFDARRIVKDFEDYDFGKIALSELHISLRHSEAPDKYYVATHKIKLNQ